MTAFKYTSVFITGCNRGIGLELVKNLASLPSSPKRIFATCRSLTAESARVLTELAAQHSQVHLLELDVNNATQLSSVVEKVRNEVGEDGLDLLINNAGVYDLKNSGYDTKSNTLDEVNAELMLKVYETNTVAPLLITKAFLPLLKQAAENTSPARRPSGVVVNISSTDASIQLCCGGHYQYKSSKAALNMVTKCLSVDLAQHDITVVCFDPGWLDTDMGGPYAPSSCGAEIPILVKTIGSLRKSSSGSFLSHKGHVLPW